MIARSRFSDDESRVEDSRQDFCFKPPGLRACVGDSALAQSKQVREFGDDFFDMVCDKHQSGSLLFPGQFTDVVEESLSSDGIEACARFVENQDGRVRPSMHEQ